jgi:hypothetical protein
MYSELVNSEVIAVNKRLLLNYVMWFLKFECVVRWRRDPYRAVIFLHVIQIAVVSKIIKENGGYQANNQNGFFLLFSSWKYLFVKLAQTLMCNLRHLIKLLIDCNNSTGE